MSKQRKISYFGYGIHSSPKFMETLLGRKVWGRKATLSNHGLFINNWRNIPKEAKTVLKENWKPRDRFLHYGIKMRRGEKVIGKLYKIMNREKEIIEKWNLCDELWFTPIKVLVDVDGDKVLAETETFLTSNSEIEYVDGLKYVNYLNKREKMYAVAKPFSKAS